MSATLRDSGGSSVGWIRRRWWIGFVAIVALLRYDVTLAQDCREQIEKHCAGIYGAGGMDVISANKPFVGQPQITVMDAGKSPAPRITGNSTGKSDLKIQWRVKPFSCIKYKIHYCTQ